VGIIGRVSDFVKTFAENIDAEVLKVRKVLATHAGLKPGRTYALTYFTKERPNQEMFVMGLKFHRGTVFYSTKHNLLFACAKFPTRPSTATRIILSKFAENPSLAKYSNIQKSLGAILGRKNVRTLNVRHISGLQQITLE